jgi:hypothetical protein
MQTNPRSSSGHRELHAGSGKLTNSPIESTDPFNITDADFSSEEDVDLSDDTPAASADWLDSPSQEADDLSVEDYDIVSAPNDWNVTTIVNFIESGAVKIPPFQRNYVWDIKRASKLIESLLLGLPVPQVFLYEEDRNSFLVIDGQQRLLSLYFFCKERFPLPGNRSAIRSLLNNGKGVSPEVLLDDTLFGDFRLRLPKTVRGDANRFSRLTYNRLGADKTTLDLRTIRNVVIRQARPEGHGAIFEIFSRLNTGGVNLAQQEIRASLYHSELMSSLVDLNALPAWRRAIGRSQPDARMRDSESILRALALARDLSSYAGSMAAFVNNFCLQAQRFDSDQVAKAREDFESFLWVTAQAPADIFLRSGKFSGVLFESFFAAWIRTGRPALSPESLALAVDSVKTSVEFAATLQEGSTKTGNVTTRVQLALNGLARANEGEL